MSKRTKRVVISFIIITVCLSAHLGYKSFADCRKSNKKALVLDVFDSQANYQGLQSGWYAKLIKDKFNIELNIIAPNVAGGGNKLFQTRCANGNLGDIIITNLDQSRLKDLVSSDLILDFTPYMDNCPNLKKYEKAILKASSLAEIKGMWAVPSEISSLNSSKPCNAIEPTVAPSIRWDIYTAIGSPNIKNTKEFLRVLKRMQDYANAQNNGEKIYSISLFHDWDNDSMQNTDAIRGMYGFTQIGFAFPRADGSCIQSIIDNDGIYKEALRFFYEANKLGLVDPDSYNQTFDMVAQKYKEGRILYSFWPWLGAGHYNTVEHIEEGKGFATVIIDDMKCLEYGCMPDGKVGTGIMMGRNCEDPQRVAEFIDWLYSFEGIMASETENGSTAGPKGICWDIVDDKPVITSLGEKLIVNGEDIPLPKSLGEGTWRDGCCALNYKSVGVLNKDEDTGISYNYLTWDDYKKKTATKLSQSWQAYYNTSLLPIEYLSNKNMLMIFPGDNIAMPDYSPELVAIKEKCRQIIIDYSWKMVFAKDDEKFESYFKDMVKMVKSIGFDKVFEEDYARSRSIIDKH